MPSAQRFPSLAKNALDQAESHGAPREAVNAGRDFVRMLEATAARRQTQSEAPGVLEHRVTPRLEWLTDLGYLSKAGLPRNGFTYRPTEYLLGLAEHLERRMGKAHWAEEVALASWRSEGPWETCRLRCLSNGFGDAFRRAYNTLRPTVGPVAVAEVSFVAALLDRGGMTYGETLEAVAELARGTPGASLSGGRFVRAGENVYFSDQALNAIGAQSV